MTVSISSSISSNDSDADGARHDHDELVMMKESAEKRIMDAKIDQTNLLAQLEELKSTQGTVFDVITILQ